MGPTFWKLQKCAAFRQPHRYQLHVALAVAFSFFEQNGTAAAKWKMGGFGQKRRYQRHLECLLGMTENDATMRPLPTAGYSQQARLTRHRRYP